MFIIAAAVAGAAAAGIPVAVASAVAVVIGRRVDDLRLSRLVRENAWMRGELGVRADSRAWVGEFAELAGADDPFGVVLVIGGREYRATERQQRLIEELLLSEDEGALRALLALIVDQQERP